PWWSWRCRLSGWQWPGCAWSGSPVEPPRPGRSPCDYLHVPIYVIHAIRRFSCVNGIPAFRSFPLALRMGCDQRGQGALDVALAVAVDHEHLDVPMPGEIQHLFQGDAMRLGGFAGLGDRRMAQAVGANREAHLGAERADYPVETRPGQPARAF